MKKFKALFLCLTLTLVVFLSGCSRQDYTLTVNKDDTSDLSIRYVVDKDTYDLLSSYDIKDNYKFEQNTTSTNEIERCDVLFQEAASIFYEYGFEIKAVNDSIEIGFEANKNYKTIESLNKDIKKLYKDGITKFKGEVSVSSNLFSKTYLFSGSVQYFLDEDMEISKEQKAELVDLYDTSSLNAEVFLKMPGNLVDLDGTVEDSKATYSATYDNGKEVPVHLKTQVVNTLVRNVIIIIAIPLIIGLVIFFARNNRKKKEEKKMKELYGDDDEDLEDY